MTRIKIEFELNDMCKLYYAIGKIRGLSRDSKLYKEIDEKLLEIENIFSKDFEILRGRDDLNSNKTQ